MQLWNILETVQIVALFWENTGLGSGINMRFLRLYWFPVDWENRVCCSRNEQTKARPDLHF